MAKSPKKKSAPKAEKVAPGLVKMKRDENGPAPHSADVHPDEVESFAAAGWERA